MTEKLLTDVEYNYKFIDERIAEAAEKSEESVRILHFLPQQKWLNLRLLTTQFHLGLTT